MGRQEGKDAELRKKTRQCDKRRKEREAGCRLVRMVDRGIQDRGPGLPCILANATRNSSNGSFIAWILCKSRIFNAVTSLPLIPSLFSSLPASVFPAAPPRQPRP